MTIYFVTSGAWGSGTGSPLAAAQVDGNFYDVDQRIVGLTADLAEGKKIDFVDYTESSFTIHYTDATTQTIPLPVLQLQYVGSWMPSTPYTIANLFTDSSTHGFYQVLQDHTSGGTFDPNATLGGNPLYQLWMPLFDTLDSLTDVDTSGAADGDVLTFVGTAGWVAQTPATPTTPSLALDDLTDVAISAPSAGQALTYNGTTWLNSALSATFDSLSDVAITTPIAGQPLVYDGSTWVNKSVADVPALNSGSKSGSFALDMQTNEFIRIQMTGNCTISSFTWPSGSSGKFVRRIVEIKNNGSFTLTWPTGTKWPSGGVPTQTTGATDVYAVFTYDGGASVFASVVAQGYS
jgi:hypothetical protein